MTMTFRDLVHALVTRAESVMPERHARAYTAISESVREYGALIRCGNTIPLSRDTAITEIDIGFLSVTDAVLWSDRFQLDEYVSFCGNGPVTLLCEPITATLTLTDGLAHIVNTVWQLD